MGQASPSDPWGELERLRESGPTDVRYDRSPRLEPGEWLPELLAEHLVPAIRKNRLAPDTRALVWVLVGPDGAVAEATLQGTSGNRAFDEAALGVARGLRYEPALRDDAPVPVWVLAEISMLLR